MPHIPLIPSKARNRADTAKRHPAATGTSRRPTPQAERIMYRTADPAPASRAHNRRRLARHQNRHAPTQPYRRKKPVPRKGTGFHISSAASPAAMPTRGATTAIAKQRRHIPNYIGEIIYTAATAPRQGSPRQNLPAPPNRCAARDTGATRPAPRPGRRPRPWARTATPHL